MTRHHLIPRTRHRQIRRKKLLTGRDLNETIAVCSSCHKQIHALISEKDLAREWNTTEKLLSHPDLGTFLDWIRQKPPDFQARVFKGRAPF